MHQLSSVAMTSSERYATFNPKYGSIAFSKDYVRDKGLAGAFVRFFVDGGSKLIGWTKCPDSELLKKDGKIKQVKQYGTGSFQMTLPKDAVLEFLGIAEDAKPFKRMAIREYADSILGQVDYISVTRSDALDEDGE